MPWPPTQSFWTFSRPSLLSQAAICHVCVMYRIQEIYRTAPRLPAGCNAVLGLEVSKNTVATNAILVKLGFGMFWGSSYDHPMIQKTSGGRHPMRWWNATEVPEFHILPRELAAPLPPWRFQPLCWPGDWETWKKTRAGIAPSLF